MCVGVCLGAARAQTPPKADDDLNDLMALRSKVMIEAYQLQMEIRQMWSDPAYTSPEIEALRKKHKALQEEILRTQTEIGAKVEALPELQPKVKKLEETNKRVEELNKKIEEKMR
ncbi:MAG: hypothetical protein FWH21_02290 [Kiritimatiellaeota bacterium]|nr:hypothetical protein [Kiritimatiellota bacterium]